MNTLFESAEVRVIAMRFSFFFPGFWMLTCLFNLFFFSPELQFSWSFKTASQTKKGEKGKKERGEKKNCKKETLYGKV